jgi:Ca-activated chloride channel homolog
MAAPTLSAAVSSTRAFVSELSPRDQLMLIGIGSETEVLAPLEVDRAAPLAALNKIDRWGTTPLFDAAVAAIDAVQAASGRRALILLSDGEDRYSRTTGPVLVEYARRHDVLVYPVSIGRTRPAIWAEVASLSGGRSFFVRDLRELTPTLQTIASELRHQYLLGYAPPEGRSGWRSIRVRVNRPQAQVRARDGYYASGH